MELVLSSAIFDSVATEGTFGVVDTPWKVYALELPYIDGLSGSAIPAGRFPIELQPSPKFETSQDPWVKKYAGAMPHINSIPSRSLIMIHWGNDSHNTDGCVLVGKTQGIDFIGHSREAFAELYSVIAGA